MIISNVILLFFSDIVISQNKWKVLEPFGQMSLVTLKKKLSDLLKLWGASPSPLAQMPFNISLLNFNFSCELHIELIEPVC